MKKKLMSLTISFAAVLALLGGLGVYQTVFADGASAPGSVDDPIVTKGYVDQVVAKLVQEELSKGGGGGGGGQAAATEVVTVPFGSKLIVGDGGEMIVRTGKAVAYSGDDNGLSDLTDGVDIKPGKAVSNNHLILNPRGERGIEADPNQSNGLIVLVRGSYRLQ